MMFFFLKDDETRKSRHSLSLALSRYSQARKRVECVVVSRAKRASLAKQQNKEKKEGRKIGKEKD